MGEGNADTGTESPSTPELPVYGGYKYNSFVRRGTTTFAHDNMVAAAEEDANRRRKVADAERALSRIPIEDGGAKMFTHRMVDAGKGAVMTRPGQAGGEAYVRLAYITNRGERVTRDGKEMVCLADIGVLEGGELFLMLVCPRCLNNKVPHGQCQMRVRQKNKWFDFDPTPTARAGDMKNGDVFVFEDRVYTSAGLVRESELFRCYQCNWGARIVNNEVRSEGGESL